MVRGRKPNFERRRQARKLREQGLSHAEIGKRMGVGSKAVVLMLTKSGGPVKAWVRCQCGVNIAQIQVRVTNGLAYCLKCLKKEDKPPLWQTAKGLSRDEWADGSGPGSEDWQGSFADQRAGKWN